jgi:hypothetical protein
MQEFSLVDNAMALYENVANFIVILLHRSASSCPWLDGVAHSNRRISLAST